MSPDYSDSRDEIRATGDLPLFSRMKAISFQLINFEFCEVFFNPFLQGTVVHAVNMIPQGEILVILGTLQNV